jgi:regulator of PEP synthase PpsR (kinase-PPPase family)
MDQRTVFFISDQTGVTAETFGQSLLTQFDGAEFRRVTIPFVSNRAKAEEAARKINLCAEVEGKRPLVFSTLVHDDLREIVGRANGLFLDFFDAFLGPIERELGVKSSHTTGRAHGMSANVDAYNLRIEATNYALTNDDGAQTRDYSKADVILVGVSRSGKTPTCLYMAMQYGIFAANYPLTEEEFESGKLPMPLDAFRSKLYGLTIHSVRLQQIRKERMEGRYSTPQQVNFELREAEKLFRKYGIPYTDTTEMSVEEIASKILEHTGLERRFRP